jgi:hypothetical protein
VFNRLNGAVGLRWLAVLSFVPGEGGFGAVFLFCVKRISFNRPVLAVLFENVAEILFLERAVAGGIVVGDRDRDVSFIRHIVRRVEEIDGHFTNGHVLEFFFYGLARLFLFGTASADKGEQQSEKYQQTNGLCLGSVTVHRLDFYLSGGAFSSKWELIPQPLDGEEGQDGGLH